MNRERIESELARLAEGGQRAEILTDGNRPVVLYHDVPTEGARWGLIGSGLIEGDTRVTFGGVLAPARSSACHRLSQTRVQQQCSLVCHPPPHPKRR